MNSQNAKQTKAEVREFEEKLIMEIQNHFCLYAKDDALYSNKQARNMAWRDISCILGKTVEECQKKWTSLRDSSKANNVAKQIKFLTLVII